MSPLSRSLAASLFPLILGCGSSGGTPSGSASASASGAPGKTTATAAATGGAAKTPPPADKVGMVCKHSFDCPRPPFDATCSYECVKKWKSEGGQEAEGYCQLRDIATAVGDGPCYGNKIGPNTGASSPEEKTPYFYLCDMDAGLTCDETTHKCVKAKAVGDACKNDNECGADGVCNAEKKACVAAGAPGASCKDVRCASASYCDKSKVCVARKANDEPCEEADQCQSITCVAGNGATLCKPAKRAECKL